MSDWGFVTGNHIWKRSLAQVLAKKCWYLVSYSLIGRRIKILQVYRSGSTYIYIYIYIYMRWRAYFASTVNIKYMSNADCRGWRCEHDECILRFQYNAAYDVIDCGYCRCRYRALTLLTHNSNIYTQLAAAYMNLWSDWHCRDDIQ